MLGLGLGTTKNTINLIDYQATAHYNRVIADGGVIPAGLMSLNNNFKLLKNLYGVSDITSIFSGGWDSHYFGYKLGAGSGTTLGQAAQKLYSICGSGGDFTQTTAASQPLLLVHSGVNYYFAPRLAGNYCSSPYNAAITLRNNLDIKAYIKPLSGGLEQIIFGSGVGSIKFSFRISSGNLLRFLCSVDGSTALIYDSTTTIPNVTDLQWVRVTRNATTGVIQFFTSSDGVTWNQLGSNVSGTTSSLFNTTSIYEIGSTGAGTTSALFQGNIYRVLVSETIDGLAVLDFNPSSYSASTNQTSWTSSTGEVWTIVTDLVTTSGYKGSLVDRTLMQFDGTNDSMLSSFTGGTAITDYLAFNQLGWVNADYVYDGPTSGAAALQMISITPRLRFEGSTSSFNTDAFTLGILSLYTLTASTTASSGIIYRNNTQQTTGGTYSEPNGIRLGARYDGLAQAANFSFRTMFRAKQVDSSTNRTGMYSIIKSMNNNAF